MHDVKVFGESQSLNFQLEKYSWARTRNGSSWQICKTSGQAAYWDGKTEEGEAVASGTYFYQLQAGDYIETKKMVILK